MSLWLDDLSRPLVEDGVLGRYARVHAISGVTCNPTIFARALQTSDRYDEQLRAMQHAGHIDAREAYFTLALTDVRLAAAVLAPLHERSRGRDGYVSFECTPDVAHDAGATVRQALAVRRRLPVPNLMVKVPATDAGMIAIEELTAAGVNINVTLLFTLGQYERAQRAFQRGLAQRLAAGDGVAAIHSVASVFVSRLDAVVDGLLPPTSQLRGRAGIAGAHRIDARARAFWRTREWGKLRKAGAHPQRLLWASTAPKDGGYPDVMYVEGLAFPDTIITMPEPTLLAFADHGRPQRATRDEGGARRLVRELAERGLDLEDLGERLLADGVERFAQDHRRALSLIEAKARHLAAGAAA